MLVFVRYDLFMSVSNIVSTKELAFVSKKTSKSFMQRSLDAWSFSTFFERATCFSILCVNSLSLFRLN